MTEFQAVVLGLLQGTGEFLPISSSAHLALAPRVFGWAYQGLAYDDCTGVVVFVLTYQKGDIKVGLVHDDLHVVFDPEMDEFSEIESVANDLGMPIEEVQARFLKAGLVRKGGTLDA